MTPVEPIARYGIRWLYHFTDEANLKPIRINKGLYSVERLNHLGIEVPRPGGNQWSREADARKGLERYVHLSFMDEHPMKYRAEQEGRIGPVRLVKVRAEVLTWSDVLFTADVSNKRGVPMLSFEKALEKIDFEVIYTRTDWRDPKIQARLQAAKRAEILVPDLIPINYLWNV